MWPLKERSRFTKKKAGEGGVFFLSKNVLALFKKIFFNIYSFLRERQRVSRAGEEREGDTESEAGSRLQAVSTEPDAGLELTDREIMTWVKVRRPN